MYVRWGGREGWLEPGGGIGVMEEDEWMTGWRRGNNGGRGG